METRIPIIWIIGGGVGILARLPLIDFLKGKPKKQLRNNNRPGREVISMDG